MPPAATSAGRSSWTSPTAPPRRSRSTRRSCAATSAASGSARTCMHRLAPPGVDPLAPEAPLAFVFSPARRHAADHLREVRGRRQVAADRPAQRRAVLVHFAIAGKLAGCDAIVVVGACDAPSVLLVDGDGARVQDRPATCGACRPPRPRSGCASGWARRGGSRPSARPGSGWCATRPSPTTTATPAAAASAPCWAPSASRRSRCAAATKCADRRPRRRGRGRRGTCASARSARPPPSTASSARSPTCSPSTRSPRLPTRNFQAATFEEAPQLAGEELAAARSVARDSCAACTIGCEHIYATKGGGQVRVEYESVFALGPLCGVGDPDAVLAARRALRRARPRHHLRRAARSPSRWSAPSAGCSTRRGCASATRRRCCARWTRSARARGWATCWPRARAARRPQVGGEAQRFAAARQGAGAARLRAAHAADDGAGLRRRRRGADHNRSGAYEADFSGGPTAWTARRRTPPLAVETEDRAALMDSLILCKFLRGVFADLYAEWADAAGGGHRLGRDRRRAARAPPRGSCSPRSCTTCARAGRAPRTRCRSVSSPSRSSWARAGSAAPPRTRLRMIDAYYDGRGLDGRGMPDADRLEALGLDLLLVH